MSYAGSADLQAAVWAALDGALDVPVHDVPPPGPLPELWVGVGAEEGRDASDATGPICDHRLRIEVRGGAAGFAALKAVAAQAEAALSGPPPALAAGRIVWLRFARARTVQGASGRALRMDWDVRVEGPAWGSV
ncbi:MAG: tail completion protein gp17 [Hasllibacter sp.]